MNKVTIRPVFYIRDCIFRNCTNMSCIGPVSVAYYLKPSRYFLIKDLLKKCVKTSLGLKLYLEIEESLYNNIEF